MNKKIWNQFLCVFVGVSACNLTQLHNKTFFIYTFSMGKHTEIAFQNENENPMRDGLYGDEIKLNELFHFNRERYERISFCASSCSKEKRWEEMGRKKFIRSNNSTNDAVNVILSSATSWNGYSGHISFTSAEL